MAQDDLAALRKQRSAWVAGINEGNADKFVSVLVEDVVWLPWNPEALVGKESVRAWLEEPFDEYDYIYTLSDVRVRFTEVCGIEEGRFTSQAQKKDGETLPLHEGDYMLLWRKDPSGQWLIERYIDRSAEYLEENWPVV
jgi:ketosteroid isomerase-like protein